MVHWNHFLDAVPLTTIFVQLNLRAALKHCDMYGKEIEKLT